MIHVSAAHVAALLCGSATPSKNRAALEMSQVGKLPNAGAELPRPWPSKTDLM